MLHRAWRMAAWGGSAESGDVGRVDSAAVGEPGGHRPYNSVVDSKGICVGEEVCYWFFCFAPPAKSDVPRIFGFAEFISALALLVITYTLVDVRYRFRLAIAPSRLYLLTFGVIGLIGCETLLTEVWLAQGWWLPKTEFLTRAIWQGYFGLLFLVTFMTWVWYAYVRPPIYGRRNYQQYAQELYNIIVKGADSELAIIADELRRSVKPLVAFAPSTPHRYSPQDEGADAKMQLSEVVGYAHDVLQLIANRKLCRHIVASSPTTAIAFFQEAVDAQKFHLPLGTFAKNISAAAIANHDSILYHEADEFSSGLIGHLKPFSQAIFGNHALMEGLGERFGSPLDVDHDEYWEWTALEWKAYCRAAVTAIGAYLSETRGGRHSYSIFRAVDAIEQAFRDTYKLNEITTDYYSTDIYKRLDVAVRFVREAVAAIDKQERPPPHVLRRRDGDHQRDIYDLLANLMFELVFAASAVSGPPDKAWSIQQSTVWMEFFERPTTKSRTWQILQFKLRRLLYDEIASIAKCPNFKNARILGYCLNVMGLKLYPGNHGREYRALAKVTHPLAQHCYPKLRQELPRVAETVLTGGITYDAEHNRLVKTHLRGLREEPSRTYLQLANIEQQPAQPGA